MSDGIDLHNVVVAVTGGGRGVGQGIAARFAAAGAVVEICGRNQPTSPFDNVDSTPHFSSVDVRDADQVESWIDDIVSRHGRIDVVVNNAGGSPAGRLEDGSPGFYRALTELNFLSPAVVMRAARPHLAERRGSIINITSISARRPSPGTAIYGAAKAALESLTRSAAVEWAREIRVNAVSCGLVATDGAVDHYGSPEQYAEIARTIPRGRLATPQEIGDVCVWLASPMAAHVTGAVIPVDGGGEWPAFLFHTPNADLIPGADTSAYESGSQGAEQ